VKAAEGTLDTLSNNKLLVAIIVALMSWMSVINTRVSAVETTTAVQEEKIETIKANTDHILSILLKTSPAVAP
jgi:hypothetical protein